MNLLIDGSIIPRPTEIPCFRDVTLYGSVFCKMDILVEFEQKDLIWEFLKLSAAHDFISAVVAPGEEHGTRMSNTKGSCNICVGSINYNNLSFIISRLQSIRYLDHWDIDPTLFSVI